MSRRRTPRRRPLDVLHRDDDWLIVDKPAGIAVHGGAGPSRSSVLERLEDDLGARPHLVHRLDRPTAGALVLAWRAEGARWLSERWARVDKRYLAVAKGTLQAPQSFDRPLVDGDGRRQAATTQLAAVLEIPTLEASMAALHLGTGRQHQIRRHLAEAGHPVLLDDRYGDFAANRALSQAVLAEGHPRPKHHLLWCRRLHFPDGPGWPPSVTAGLPRSWAHVLLAAGLSVDAIDALT